MNEKQSTILSNKFAILGVLVGIVGTLFSIYSTMQSRELKVTIEQKEQKETIYIDTIHILKERIKEVKVENNDCSELQKRFEKLSDDYKILEADCFPNRSLMSSKCGASVMELISVNGSESGQFIELMFKITNSGPNTRYRFYCNNCGNAMTYNGKEYNYGIVNFGGKVNSRDPNNASTGVALDLTLRYNSILKESLKIPSLQIWSDSFNRCKFEFKNIKVNWN